MQSHTSYVPIPSIESTSPPLPPIAPTETLSSSTASIEPSSTSSTLVPSSSTNCRPTAWTRDGKAPSTGILRAAFVFVDFPDAPTNTSTEEIYSEIKTGPAEFFKTISYGKLDFELVPLLDKFYRMPSASGSYNYSRGLTTEAHLKYINDALSEVPSTVNFAGVDVLFVVPAKHANEISFSTSTAVDVTAPDGSVIGASITIGQDMYNSWGYKTINHEAGHTMGLPDLYPYGGGEVTKWVGGFDIMGLISGQSPDYFAWHKWQLGWILDEQVDCVQSSGSTTHRISPIETDSETRDVVTKAVAIPLSETTYIMAEVRSNLGVDGDGCVSGVLLYTTDTALGSGDGPIRVIDTKPNSGGCGPELGRELNDAPLLAGEQFDTGMGVIISVVEQDGDEYVVEVIRDS